MECKTCGYPDSKVVETNKSDDLKQIYRRRECIKCGVRFTTQEHSRDNYKRVPHTTNQPKSVLTK